VSASEAVTGEVVEAVSEKASDGEFEASGTVTEAVVTTEAATVAATEEIVSADATIAYSEEITEIDGEALVEIIEGSESKTQAVIKLAEMMGITVEDAEALIDKFITFGDEHFEDSDLWATLKADVETHPDKWIIIALVALAFVALVVFLIRSTVKNTLTQTNTKIKIGAIESHAAGVEAQVKENKAELDAIKAEADELREMLGTILELITIEREAVDSLKANSDTSLKVTEESAFQILQLLNIAMDRKVPIVNEAARKLWYQDAVAKVKARAGLTDQTGGESHG
jgi:hypothetical protein